MTASAIPKFAFRELTLGNLVGQGGFSVVHEVRAIQLNEVYDTSEEESALRQDFANVVNNGASSYVLKTLRTDLPEEEHTKGIVDLAIEADFLGGSQIHHDDDPENGDPLPLTPRLEHEHIICMRAMANSDPHSNRFFVVLDRLTMTLDRKCNFWRKIVGESAGYYLPCYGYCCARVEALVELWKERFRVSLAIASAMHYLHERKIVYRDLKPDNVGFDSANVPKIFDFGLAKRLEEVERLPTGLYRLTGNTGSLRYMAPEIARCLPYDASVDVYSFGIIFWQICSLQTPYAKYTAKMHAERVVRLGVRPKPDPTWPETWGTLQQTCWSTEPSERPTFTNILEQLTTLLADIESEEMEGVVPSRAAEIRAKKKKKPVAAQGLDVDTRIRSAGDDNASASAGDGGGEASVKRYDNEIV